MVSNTIVPVADLAITQFSAAPDPVVYGSALTYTAVVTNNGPSAATGVTFTLPMPGDITFGSGSWAMVGTPAVSGTVNPQGSNLVGSIGDLAVGSSAKVTIVVTPQQSAVGPLAVTGTAAGGQYNALPAAATDTVTTTVNDQPGNLQFTASNYGVDENAGSAAITVVRTDGLSGQVSVNFTTVPMGATAGLDYTPVSETAVFPAGIARETIQVPVLADPYDDHNETVGLAISDPTGGAGLGSPTTATLTIIDTDPNSTVPTVAAVQWTGTSRSITSLIISFNEPLDPATAENPANYAVAGVGKKGSFSTQHGQNVSFAAPAYDQANWSVTLVPTAPLGINQFYSLFLKGTQGGITNGGGIELAGAGAGRVGTNFTALFAQGTNLKYTDAGGNQVTFGVKGGGYLQDLLTGSGLGQRLVLVGGVAHPYDDFRECEAGQARQRAGVSGLLAVRAGLVRQHQGDAEEPAVSDSAISVLAGPAARTADADSGTRERGAGCRGQGGQRGCGGGCGQNWGGLSEAAVGWGEATFINSRRLVNGVGEADVTTPRGSSRKRERPFLTCSPRSGLLIASADELADAAAVKQCGHAVRPISGVISPCASPARTMGRRLHRRQSPGRAWASRRCGTWPRAGQGQTRSCTPGRTRLRRRCQRSSRQPCRCDRTDRGRSRRRGRRGTPSRTSGRRIRSLPPRSLRRPRLVRSCARASPPWRAPA